MEVNSKKESRGVRIFLILSIIVVLIMAAIAAPSYFCYRPACYCMPIEEKAYDIAEIMADYFSKTEHHSITRADIEKRLALVMDNPWMITQCGDDHLVHIVDHKKKCPLEFQNNNPGWEVGIFTLKVSSKPEQLSKVQ